MRAIDTLHLGRRRWICCWQVGQVLVDPGPTLSLEHVLAELDGWQPQAILLTEDELLQDFTRTYYYTQSIEATHGNDEDEAAAE